MSTSVPMAAVAVKANRHRVACRLNDAFEPTQMEPLRKTVHTVWTFEPEDDSASEAAVVVGSRD